MLPSSSDYNSFMYKQAQIARLQTKVNILKSELEAYKKKYEENFDLYGEGYGGGRTLNKVQTILEHKIASYETKIKKLNIKIEQLTIARRKIMQNILGNLKPPCVNEDVIPSVQEIYDCLMNNAEDECCLEICEASTNDNIATAKAIHKALMNDHNLKMIDLVMEEINMYK